MIDRPAIDTLISSYVACAELEERDVDWNEIRDAITNEGVSDAVADAAIDDYLARIAAPADLRETAWALLDIFELGGGDKALVARYHDAMFTFETEGVERVGWDQVVTELRDLTIATTQSDA